MTRPQTKAADQIVETWETSSPGTTWVWVYDRREDKYVEQRVGGREGSGRIHLSRDDRKYNQERVPIENRMLDPFTNGALRLVEASERDEALDIRYHYSDADLMDMFEVRDENLFADLILEIESELIIRRLLAMAEKAGTQAQTKTLRDTCDERWPIGGTQKTVREMIEAGERIGATQIY